MRFLLVALLLIGLGLGKPLRAAEPATNDVALADVLRITQRNAALYSSLRLQLWRARLASTDIVCRGHRFDGNWAQLTGKPFGPYECPIGQRTVFITATQSYYDARGRKLLAVDPALPSKAVRIAETNFKWRWRDAR